MNKSSILRFFIYQSNCLMRLRLAITRETSMSTILEIHSSINGRSSVSSSLVGTYVESWRERHPEGRVITRDVNAQTVPHLDGERFGAFLAPAAERDSRQQAHVAYSDALIDELRGADTIVLGVPMYNFSVPSTLKAWMDHVARAGVTFKYTDSGPVGLLEGKRAIVVATRGGRYAGTDADSQTPFLRTFLSFIGIKDVRFVYAEGLNLGEESKNEAVSGARTELLELARVQRAA
jgi:FMN-dependent NADH-azoreductase